jgi:ParB-like chromosome segregation protein Spo0J
MAKSKKSAPAIPTDIAIEQWPVDKPVPHPKNARVITEKAVTTVAASIKAYGFNQPIIVDAAGVIIAGHTRLRAAKHLGLETVPVMVAKHLTKEQVDTYRLMDNRSAQETMWDVDILAEVLAEMSQSTDTSLLAEQTGFDLKEVEAYIGDLATIPSLEPEDREEKPKKEKKPKGDVCTCPKCGFTYTKGGPEIEEGEDTEDEEEADEPAPKKAPAAKPATPKRRFSAFADPDED